MNAAWKVLFSSTALAVGVFLLYAAWADYPTGLDAACASLTGPSVVHFSPAFVLDYTSSCGAYLKYKLHFFLGFTLGGGVFIFGGLGTLYESIR